jgi:hypothetical protein
VTVRARSHRIGPIGLAIAATLGVRTAAAAPPCDDPLKCSIPSNHYALDLFQGALLAPLRVTGIAGAYAGYAEGIEGMVSNAAAPAVREPFSANWLEGDISASISIPITLFKNNDFDNSGQIDFNYSNFVYITAGAVVQLGMVGLGARPAPTHIPRASPPPVSRRSSAFSFGPIGPRSGSEAPSGSR